MLPRSRTRLIRGAVAAALLLLSATACDGSEPVTTRIVLAAAAPDGGAPTANALADTGALLSRRFVDAGLAAPRIEAAAAELLVTVEGEVSPELVASLVVTGELRFRKVLLSNAGSGSAGAVPGDVRGTRAERTAAVAEKVGEAAMAAAEELVAGGSGPETTVDPETMELLAPFGELTGAEVAVLPVRFQFSLPTIRCAQLDSRPYGAVSEPNELAVACDDAGTRYLLDLAPVQGTDVAEVRAEPEPVSGRWVVTLEFTGEGQARWTELTREATQNNGAPFDPAAVSASNRYQGTVPIGCGSTGDQGSCLVAMVRDNRVISAPQIMAVINGPAQVTGAFTEDEAELLAAQLQAGPLPLALDVISVTTGPVGSGAGPVPGR